MTKKTLAVALSILIALMPFLGFPVTVKTIFYVSTGLLLVILIELISIQGRKRARGEDLKRAKCYADMDEEEDVGEVCEHDETDNENFADQDKTQDTL